jgi:hypothetical protein
MIRRALVEQILRQVYGAQPADDAQITVGLVNQYITQGVGVAARQAYHDAIKLDGIGYVNGAFHTTFKELTVAADERFLYKITLPDMPVGIGRGEGISTVKFKGDGQVSHPCIPLSQAQKGYHQSLRPIPNKTLYYSEGKDLYAVSTLPLHQYSAQVTMVSAGDPDDLDAELHVPPDYIPVIVEYVKSQLFLQKQVKPDLNNDGTDQA